MTADASPDDLQRRAESGDLTAMRQLGDVLHERMRTRSQALGWWQKAADAGDLESTRRMARHARGTEDRERWRGRLARAERGPRPDLIPAEATEAAAAAGLGRGVSTFGSFGPPGPDRSPQGCFVTVGILGLAAVVVALIGAGAADGPRVALFVVAGVLAVIALLGWLAARGAPKSTERNRLARGRTCVFEGGLVHLAAEGAPYVFPWHRTRSTYAGTRHLRNGSYTHTTYATTLLRDDGQKVVYSGDSRFNLENQILGEEATVAITRVRVPAVWEALARGERRAFGDITIDASGITAGRDTLGWDQVEKIELTQGYVRIRRRGGFFVWSRTAASGIPDLRTFLHVANELKLG